MYNRNEFGRILQHHRDQRNEKLIDTANLLHVSPSYVSNVETGKLNLPTRWIPTLVAHYDLSEEEVQTIHDFRLQSRKQIRLNLSQASEAAKTVALLFEEQFSQMSDETAAALIRILI